MRNEILPRNPLQIFGGVVVLNLPDRTDRLAETRQELAKLHPEAASASIVFAGVRGSETHGFPSPGAYGCFRGHLGILRLARERGMASVLVLEDDVCFTPDEWHRDWDAIEVELSSTSWDIVNLGFDPQMQTEGKGKSGLVPVHEPLMLAHCYAVHGRALDKLIAFLEALERRPAGDPLGGPMHYDGALFHFCRDVEGVVRFRPERSLAGQRSSRSDIAGSRWFDWNVPVVRKLVGWARAVKNRSS